MYVVSRPCHCGQRRASTAVRQPRTTSRQRVTVAQVSRDISARQARRNRIADEARAQSGLLTTSQLRALGITIPEIRAELAAQRWNEPSAHVVRVAPRRPGDRAAWWAAVLACSPRGRAANTCTAALGGLTSLFAAGLEGIDGDGWIHIAAPKSSRPLPGPDGVRIHETRRWRDEDIVAEPIPRVRTSMAAVQAALWARTDREAALLLVAPVQQRLATSHAVRDALENVRRDKRRTFLRAVADEIVDGVRSRNELDFARMCRARGLPEPSRQVVVRTASGRAYLDVRWDRWRVTVEIDGIGHLRVDRWLDDSLRHNEIALTGDVVLRVPSLGLRLDHDRHMDLVERALRGNGWSPLPTQANVRGK